ncbi:MAG TPA: cytochrome P450 [Macromonas sp.]|nr:cytochrome P450 [Macromonas sp.]
MSTQPTDTEVQFNHNNPELMQNPWPLYEKFRSGKCPVNHSSELGGFWTVASFDAIKHVEFNHQTFTSTEGTGLPPHPERMYPIDLDPPKHTQYRMLLNKHFTLESSNKWREGAIEETHALIDNFIERGEADLAAELCRPMPPTVVLPMLGVPPEYRADVCEWIEQMTRLRATEPMVAFGAWQNVVQLLLKLSAERRNQPPQGDLMDALHAATIDGKPLTDDDVFRTLSIILFGGLDTTTAVMLMALKHFDENPQDRDRYLNEPGLKAVAMEEFVRYTSPIQGLRRVVTQDTELEGVPLEQGESVFLLYGSGNRDETKFPDANRCVIDRGNNHHMGFGIGPHVCLGRNFARMEFEVLMTAVLERMPDFKLKPGTVIEFTTGEARGIKSFPVTFTPGKRRGS